MVSVIMPTYNREKVIQRAIKSVLRQSYQNFELIIVDDGSTDDTEHTVRLFNDERILYYKCRDNYGANHARNIGLQMAKGEIIAFLDSDNEWYTDYLKLQNDVLDSDKIDVSFCKYERLFDGINSRIVPSVSGEDLDISEIVERMINGNIMDTNVTCIKRTLYRQWGGFDEELQRFQDWDYFLTLIERGARVIFNNVVESKNYTMSDSITTRDDLRDSSFAYVFRKHRNYYKDIKKIGQVISNIIDYMIDKKCFLLEQEIKSFLRDAKNNNTDDIKVILYGYGNRGKVFLRLLNGEVNVSVIIDKYAERPNDVDVTFQRNIGDIEKNEYVVVTVRKDCEVIKQELEEKTGAHIYEISNFLEKIVYGKCLH